MKKLFFFFCFNEKKKILLLFKVKNFLLFHFSHLKQFWFYNKELTPSNAKNHNNCFKSIKCNTILPQAKRGKHECSKIAALVFTYFRLKKDLLRFLTRNNCWDFFLLHLMMLIFKAFIIHFSKRQFVVLLVAVKAYVMH